MADVPHLSLRHEPRLDAKHAAFGYQAEAVDFIAARPYAAIFHEQGLGKTKIAIDVALRWLSQGEVDRSSYSLRRASSPIGSGSWRPIHISTQRYSPKA